jgi:FlaA1/EpsC-like NDP-sugar epimerase
VVGLLDDDILLRGQYIGGAKVLGTLMEAPEIVNRVNADAVVIACEVTDDWLKVIRETLAPTGVKITHFNFTEKEI